MGEISIVGSGVNLGLDWTVHAIRMLQRAEVVYTIIREPFESWQLPGVEIERIIWLDQHYLPHRRREENYWAAASEITRAAENGRSVAYLTYGAPTVYDRVTTDIVAIARSKGIGCKIISSVSSIDGITAFLGRDLAPGIIVAECRWLVNEQVTLPSGLNLLLTQPAAIATDKMVTASDLKTSSLESLRSKLLTCRAEDQEVIFVRAPCGPEDPGYLRATVVGQMTSGCDDDLMGTSIYVPIQPKAFK